MSGGSPEAWPSGLQPRQSVKFQEIRGYGGRRVRCRIQLFVSDPQDIFRTHPGNILEGARFFMGQIALVGGQAPSQESVPYAGFGEAVFGDAFLAMLRK